MSFYTALTGLNGAQTDIATISNNIANVGTTGFKQSRVQFGDIFATSPLQNATSAVGEGTIVKSIQQEFTQGSIQSSANTTDLAISGQGFFALKPSLTSTQTVYSRDGSFSVNSDRYVVDNQGQFLQVFPVNSDGSATSTDAASATNLQLPLNSGLPKATSAIQLGINLPAAATIIPASSTYNSSNPYVFNKDDASTYNQSTSITIYDSLGNPTIATIYYVKTSNSTSTDPTNKWATHVYVGDKELNPSLITAKNPQGQTLYVNKFGQTTTDPTQVGNPNSSAYVPGATSDPAFIAGQPGPLYYQDDQTDTSTSSPASVTSATPPVNGFNFGSTDNNPVTIVTDPSQYQNTYESDPSHTSTYWGTDMFTVSVDGSTPQSISINAGTYTGTQLAAEMTRAVNAKFSGANSYQITDTYRTGDGSLISGNDVFNIGLSGTDASGGSMALNPPLQIDLLGTAGSSGTPQVPGAGAQPIPNTNLTQQQLVDLAQAKINEQLNARANEFGATNGWVTSDKEPIKVGYDVASRSLTFTADPTLLGADAILPGNRYSSIQVYNPTSSTNNLGIPTQASSPTAVIGSSTPWQGEATLPSGPPLGGTVQKNGITITYDKNAQKFTFSSGTTGENSSIEVGRANLTPPGQNTPQVSTYKLTQSPTLAAGSNFTLESKGQTFNYMVPTTLNMTSPTDQQTLVSGLQQAVPAYIGQPQVTQTGGSGVDQIESIAFSGNLLPGDVYQLNMPGLTTPIEIDAGTLDSTTNPTAITNWAPDATKTPAGNLLACLNASPTNVTALANAGITVGLSSDGTSLTFKYANTGSSTPIASTSSVTTLNQSVRGVAYTATSSGSTTTFTPVAGQATFDLLPPTVTTSPTITSTSGNSNTQEVQTAKFSSTSPNTNVKILPGDQFIVSIPGPNGSVTTQTVTMPAYSGSFTGPYTVSDLATQINSAFGYTNSTSGFKQTGTSSLQLTYSNPGAVTGKFSISQIGVGETDGTGTPVVDGNGNPVSAHVNQTGYQANVGPLSFSLDPTGQNLVVTGGSDGSAFNLNLAAGGVVLPANALGTEGSHPGIQVGQAKTDSTDIFAGSNALLNIGAGSTVTSTAGTGLPSSPAMAYGATATVPMSQTFTLNVSSGENQMTFTIDGITGSITLPNQAYTGDTLAAAIQKRINEIQDPQTGLLVSGAQVSYDSTANRLVFTSGTTGSQSQFNVVGAANLGLNAVTTVAGKVPVITTPTQAKDSSQSQLYVDANGNITPVAPSTPAQAWIPLYLTPGELTFDSSGKLVAPSQGVVYSPFNPGNGANPLNLNVNYGVASTQYNQPFSVLSLQQDGYTSGQLNGLTIDSSGTVKANYTNGQTQALGKIILANFANPNGLTQVGNSDYVASSNSGSAVLGVGGSNGFGSIQSGALETSNVDITQELVSLITAQQNFQANSKVISTESDLTDKIIQIQG